MGNIIWGILFIIGGASGEFVLTGTDSCQALIYVGIGLIVFGIIRLATSGEADNNDNANNNG